MSLVSKSLNNLVYSEVNANGEISDNQIKCAKTIISAFDSEYPKTNYVIVKGQAQTGKTGIFFGLVNIINRLRLKETLNLKGIIYITADNSKGLVRQQYERAKKSLMTYNDDDVQVSFLKRSDFKHFRAKVDSIDNYIIFIDESHFGTSKENNLLPQFLKYYGIDYLKNTNLEDHNVRIISNTATPYSELESDKVENKITVFFEPSDGYVGLTDFADNTVLLKKNAFDRRIAPKALPKLFNDIHDYLKGIEKDKHQVKCAIVRACGRNNLADIYKYGGDLFDIQEFDTSRGYALNYDLLWDRIDLYCGMGKGRTPGKYLMVVVKDALRMGISVREREDHNNTKNRIAVLYDYPSDKEKPDVTEQGLLGRMCGYRDQGDEEWKDVRFYLNECHYVTLKNFYKDRAAKKLKLAKLALEKEEITDITGMTSEYDAKEKGMDAEVLKKDGKLYCIDVPGNNDWYYQYDATEFYMSKVGKPFGGFDKFKLSDLKTNFHFTDNFIRPFLEYVDEHYASKNYVNKGSRRCGVGVGENEASFIEDLKDGEKRMHISSSAYPFKNEDLGKFAWQALLNMDEMYDPVNPKIYVHVKVAKMVPFRYVEKVVENGHVRTAETMITG